MANGEPMTVTIDADKLRSMAGRIELRDSSMNAAIGEVEALVRENWEHIWRAFEQHRIDNPSKKYSVSLACCMEMVGRNSVRVNATCSYGTKRSDETDGVMVGQSEPELPLDGVNCPTEDQVALAKSIILETGRASVSSIQRRMRISFTLASQILDRLQDDGIVSDADARGEREIIKA